MFTKITDWLMGLLVRTVIALAIMALALAFFLYEWRANMDRDTKKYLKWWCIVALAVVVANLLAGCASAQNFSSLVRRNVMIQTDWSQGSGVIFKKDTILTAGHMLGPNMKVDGKPAVPIFIDTAHDLLIVITTTDSVPDLRLNLIPTPLQVVIAVGNPMGKRNFFSVGYVAWSDGEIINSSNIVMPGYSGSGAYDERGALLGLVVAGEGNCVFGYTIDRLVSSRRVLQFVLEKPTADFQALLTQKAQVRGTRHPCPDKAPTIKPP